MDKPPPPVKGLTIYETKVAQQPQQKMMLRNVGLTDRVIRAIIGFAFIPAAVVSRKITPCIIASLFIASGGMGYCPVYFVIYLIYRYHALHLNTLTKPNKDKKE